jgi:hypothetical protein
MQKRNHIIFGLVLSLLFIIFLGWLRLDWFNFTFMSIFSIVGISVFYSLLPDIDHKNSTITWWFFGIGVAGLILGMIGFGLHTSFYNAWSLMIISSLLIIFTYLAVTLFDHRGFIHSVPVGLLAIIPLFFLFHSFAYCALGYVAWHSHLLGDGYLFKLR